MPEPAAPTSDAQRRFRAFALAHHPDRGGDPEIFLAALAARREGRPPAAEDVPTVYRRRRGIAGWLGRGRPRPPERRLR